MPTLPFKLNQDRRHHIPKQKHKLMNSLGALLRSWREYDASLRQRGSLTVWFTDEAIEGWRATPRTTPGGQPWYSPLAILTALTLRAVFRLALRQTEGLIGSVIGLLGLTLAVPDHTTLMWTALGRQRLSVLSQHSRVPLHSLCFPDELLLGVGRGSGQSRPPIRPVVRRVPLAIMGVRSRVRHQSEQRAQGAASYAVSPELS